MKIVHRAKKRGTNWISHLKLILTGVSPQFLCLLLPGLSLLLLIFFIIKSRGISIQIPCKSYELIPSFAHFLQQRYTRIETGSNQGPRRGDFADVKSLLLQSLSTRSSSSLSVSRWFPKSKCALAASSQPDSSPPQPRFFNFCK